MNNDFLDCARADFAEALQILGTTAFTIEDQAPLIHGSWNDLGRNETVELAGRRVTFSVIVEAARNQFDAVPVQGLRVTRVEDGAVFRIVGEIHVDEIGCKFALQSVNR